MSPPQVGGMRGRPAPARAKTDDVEAPPALRLAALIITLQAAGEAVAIGWRDDFRWPLRITMIVLICTQLLFARGVVRLWPGAAFGVFAYQIATVVAALGTRAPLPLRGLLGLSAVAVFALVGGSLGAFPEPDLPIPRGPR